jgi:Protein of unknown function (DUF2752)
LPSTDEAQQVLDAIPVLRNWVRGMLLGVAVGLAGVFAVAFRLDPYRPDGSPRRLETHRQLGLPPCTFRVVTGVPCPSCGMTTSFALLMRGDLVNSLRANSVGTLLALFWLALIPWGLLSAWRAKPVWVRSVERTLTWVVLVFLVLTLLRWGFVLGVGWLTGSL